MRFETSALTLCTIAIAACSRTEAALPPPARATGTVVAVRDSSRPDYFEASGVANPMQQATLSTRLMATVLEVKVLEGARVSAGELLVQLDATDLAAKRRQATSAVDDASTMRDLAKLTADRVRALYADSAAPRAQLDAAESGLARANAGLVAAREAIAEIDATMRYAEVRAPFAGVVTHRFVDPGAFAAPGAPLVTIESGGGLRITATIPASMASGLRPGAHLVARLENEPADAVIEGVVPGSGNLYTVNAIVANERGALLAASAATLLVPHGMRRTIVVPVTALLHQGDLIGVRRRFATGDAITWVKTGATMGSDIEIVSGLALGDSVVISGGSR